MFNVSAWLMDDALLKCVVTEVLFLIVAFETLTFHKATHLRCGEIFNDSIITNVLLIQTYEISLKISQYLTKLRRTKQSVPVFLGHPVGWIMHRPTTVLFFCKSHASDR